MSDKIISNFFLDNRIGGPHNYIKNINEFIKIKKNKLKYITCGKSNFSHLHLTNLRFFLKPLFLFEIILNIFEIISLNNCKKIKKVMFVHSILNVAPIIAGSLLNKKVYWFILETPNKLTLIIYKTMKLFFNFKTVVISKKIAKILNEKKFFYIPPVININFWKASNKRKSFKKKIKILCVGNINKVKGYDFLLDSLKKVDFDWTLRIVGAKIKTQKYYLKKIEKIIYEMKDEKRTSATTLVGWLSEKKLKREYNDCDLFIMPSKSEGSPISLYEAMAMKCFCISTKVGDVEKIIINKKNGILVNYDKKNIIEALNYYHKLNYKKLLQFRSLAREKIIKVLPQESYYKKFYNNL